MSLSKYAAPLRLDLKHSRKLFAFILASHIVAAISIPLLPLWLAGFCAAAITFSLIYNLRHLGYITGGNDIVTLIWGTDGLWTIIRRDGSASVAQLKPDTYVNPLMVIVSLAENGTRARHRVVILSDTLDPGTFRQLRVRLTTQV